MSDLKDLVHKPEKAAQDTYEHIQQTAKGIHGKGWPLPFGNVCDYFGDLMPGQTCVVCAGTSNYKTSFMQAWIEANMHHVEEETYVLYFSTEETVEELTSYSISKRTKDSRDNVIAGRIFDWDALKDVIEEVGNLRIVRIADSLLHGTDGYNMLTVSNMRKIIASIKTGKTSLGNVNIAAAYFDYLQSFPIDPEAIKSLKTGRYDRRLMVKADFYALRDLAKEFKIPTIVGSQAREDLKAPRSMYLPNILENMESTDIGRRADRQISLWLPKTDYNPTTKVKHGSDGAYYIVEENLMFLKVAKQRGGLPAGKTFAFNIDYKKNELIPLELSDVIR